jgi:hypothetical protein
LPVVVKGGHTLAHAPEHADLPFLSLTHRYTACPLGPTRYVPAELWAVFTTTLVAEALVEAGVELAACVEEWGELELPHAATTTATPTPRAVLAKNRILLRLTILAPSF